VLGAVAVVVVTGLLVLGIRGRVGQADSAESHPTGHNGFLQDWRLVRAHRPVRLWAIGNSCWEAAIGVLRTFVVLYFTKGLGLSLRGASAALGLVGIAAVIAAPVAGKLADRYGSRSVMNVAVWVFAIGLIPPLVTTNKYFIAAILPIAFAAVVLMTLPYALLMDLLPNDDSHGAEASLFGFSRGVGIIVGPLLAGLAIQLTAQAPALTLAQTKGYSAMFAVAMVLLLVSTPVLRRIKSDPS
jgi:MFS family permease